MVLDRGVSFQLALFNPGKLEPYPTRDSDASSSSRRLAVAARGQSRPVVLGRGVSFQLALFIRASCEIYPHEGLRCVVLLPPTGSWPPGVSRGLWDYLHDPAVARGYDASLAGSSLFRSDEAFVERHCPTPGRLIDLGCGTGRLLLPLAHRGYWVLGVDLSAEMLRVAGEKAAAAGVNVHLLRANLAELGCLANGSFDWATCLFSTLGMVAGAEQRQRVVKHAYRLLRPGGRLVLHVHNRWFNFWDPQGRRWLLGNALAALAGGAGRRLRDAGPPGHRQSDPASVYAARPVGS